MEDIKCEHKYNFIKEVKGDLCNDFRDYIYLFCEKCGEVKKVFYKEK